MGYPIEIGTHPLQPCTVSHNDGKPLRVKTFVNWEDITILRKNFREMPLLTWAILVMPPKNL